MGVLWEAGASDQPLLTQTLDYDRVGKGPVVVHLQGLVEIERPAGHSGQILEALRPGGNLVRRGQLARSAAGPDYWLVLTAIPTMAVPFFVAFSGGGGRVLSYTPSYQNDG